MGRDATQEPAKTIAQMCGHQNVHWFEHETTGDRVQMREITLNGQTQRSIFFDRNTDGVRLYTKITGSLYESGTDGCLANGKPVTFVTGRKEEIDVRPHWGRMSWDIY